MTNEQIAELAQLKAQYPIVSGNDYSRMDAQERNVYFHLLDLLELENSTLAGEDEGYPECDEVLVAAEW